LKQILEKRLAKLDEKIETIQDETKKLELKVARLEQGSSLPTYKISETNTLPHVDPSGRYYKILEDSLNKTTGLALKVSPQFKTIHKVLESVSL
jgi:hypothetical protein